ncbi:MAG: response regulator [Chloroflexi bacterium]|nr:response regulator [Chloroflexota bacterium]
MNATTEREGEAVSGEVLLVDDSPAELRALAGVLKAHGYRVRAATTGERGIAAAQLAPPDVILLDVMLPDMSGYDVCRRLKHDPRTTAVGVLFLSSLDTPADKLRGFDAGGADYVTKPFHAPEIVARVQVHVARRQAERERERILSLIDQERSTLAAVMDSMRDGLVVVNAAGNIRYCNSRAGDLLGVPAGRAFGRRPHDVFASVRVVGAPAERDAARPADGPPSGAPAGWSAILDTLRSAGTVDLVCGGPSPCDVQVFHFPIVDSRGAGMGYGLLMRDVTEERALERAKEDFTSMISHELRTPLSAIKGFARTLLQPPAVAAGSPGAQSPAGGTPVGAAQQRQFLFYIDQACDRLLGLVEQLLEMAQMAAGEFAVEPRGMPVAPLVRAAVRRLRAAKCTCRMDVSAPARLPRVLADGARIEQVLHNLLDNACKYAGAGGAITVTARRDADQVVISVADEGEGIPAGELAGLFDRYRRGRSARLRRVGGSGLGLAIARGIVEAHGGRIWAESPVPGRPPGALPGAVFHFTLPCAVEAAPHPLTPSPTRGEGERLRRMEE